MKEKCLCYVGYKQYTSEELLLTKEGWDEFENKKTLIPFDFCPWCGRNINKKELGL